jgi:hypothetical protein
MSDTTEITRRPRSQRPEREIHRQDDPPAVVIEHTGDQLSPEDALADAQRQLVESDKRTAEARRLQREADQRARQAEAQAAQASAGRTTDRQSVVAAAIEAAKAEQTSARLAYRHAREAGDIEAEVTATEALSNASLRLQQATAEHEWLKNQPKQQPTPSGPSAAAQRWLDEHPAYHSDRKYRGTAQTAHTEALQAGKAEGSQEYVDFIDRIMTEEYGEGHGQPDSGERRTMPEQKPQRQPARGDAAPPSRHTGGSSGGWKTVDTGMGQIQYQDRPDGSRGIRFTKVDQKDDFEEGARISRMSLADYANDHIAHALEIAGGARGDIIRGDGGRYE